MFQCEQWPCAWLTATSAWQAPQPWQPRMEPGGPPSAMAALVLTLGEGVERFRLTPEGARGFTVEGLRAIWKVRFVELCSHRAAEACLQSCACRGNPRPLCFLVV